MAPSKLQSLRYISPVLPIPVCLSTIERWWESKVPWLWWSALNQSLSQSDGAVGPLGEDHRERSQSAGMLLELLGTFVCVHLILVKCFLCNSQHHKWLKCSDPSVKKTNRNALYLCKVQCGRLRLNYFARESYNSFNIIKLSALDYVLKVGLFYIYIYFFYIFLFKIKPWIIK